MNAIVFLTMLAMPLLAWVAVSWIKMQKTGNAVHRSDPDTDRKVALLAGENEKLIGKISRLEDRIAVLERIATDPATRTAHAIEQLR